MDCVEIWNSIIDRAGENFDALSSAEQLVFRVNRVAIDGSQGGYLYNVSPAAAADGGCAELRADADAVEAVGDAVLAEAMRRVASALERGASAQARTWGEFIGPVEKEVTAFEEVLETRAQPLFGLLEDFTLRHLGASDDQERDDST